MTKFFQCGMLFLALLMGNGMLHAEITAPPVPPYTTEIPKEGDRFMGEFMYMLFVLGAVIAVMILVSWFVKRLLQTKVQQLNQTSLIKITESRVLGQRSLLHLIEVHGMTILISETPAGVQALAKFKTDETFDQLMSQEPPRL